MPTRYNTGEYSYDLEYHYGDMSASMEMLRARLIELLTPHLSGRYVKWREAYFTRFTKCGGDSGWMFCVGPHEFHIDGALRRYYSGSIDITYNQKDRYFLVGEKRKSNVRLVRGLASFEMMGGGI
ncbi:hypothetical protein [Acinetobacter baumannii]|uniref:hypothetical protein n=1 Tax=Acinetobacter baumannii TaxID=470 RepID=UPI000F18164D|nr:hypothetical protein [Acinetobacter baumannii]UQL42208.1 hypothetical protein M1S33_07455 [Acinetobacter baumannii]VCW44245.1 hypothetical protein BANRA_01897 [Acinetobacter baumannii]